MPTTISYRFTVRRGTASAWTSGNPILLQGEFGLELDTLLVKMGDGTTDWNTLTYFYATSAVMSKILDSAFSASQGSILYRSATAWTALAPGTAGKFLKTLGSSANPVWDTPSGGGGGGGSSNITPDTHPIGPTPQDDEFESGAFDAPWSWQQQNSASDSFSMGSIVVTGQVTASNIINAIDQSFSSAELTAGAWRYRAKVAFNVHGATNFAGLHLRESSTGKVVGFGNFNPGGITLIVATGDMPSGYLAVPFSTSASSYTVLDAGNISQFTYYEIELASGTMHYRVSLSGQDGTFTEVYSVAVTSQFTVVPDHIGLCVRSANASTPASLMCDWFRDFS